MTIYKYFTKDTLIEAARAGNERGYNRQLDPDHLTDLEFENFLPITFTLLHEHIAGELVEPHLRAMVMVGPDETVMLDMSQERYDALPKLDSESLGGLDMDEQDATDGAHRTARK